MTRYRRWSETLASTPTDPFWQQLEAGQLLDAILVLEKLETEQRLRSARPTARMRQALQK